MANNRLAFGLCKKYGIELPDNATPKDAWEALNKISANEFKKPLVIYGDKIRNSVGAHSPTYPVVYYPNTDIQVEFVIGSRPVYSPDHIIAGKGCKTGKKIDEIDRLVDEYNCDASGWKKDKARYEAYDEYGVIRQVELHWYHHEDIGKVEYKLKTKKRKLLCRRLG